jgi:hypothetical protein
LYPGPTTDSTEQVAYNFKIRSSTQRTIQINHVDPPGTLLHEVFGYRNRVIPINGLPRRLALAQANDAAVPDIYGWKEIHYSVATATTESGFQVLAER